MNNVPPAKQEHPAAPDLLRIVTADPDLERIVADWPSLPQFVREGVMTLIAGPDEIYGTKPGLVRVQGALPGRKTRHLWNGHLLQSLEVTSGNFQDRMKERILDDTWSVEEMLREKWNDPNHPPKVLGKVTWKQDTRRHAAPFTSNG